MCVVGAGPHNSERASGVVQLPDGRRSGSNPDGYRADQYREVGLCSGILSVVPSAFLRTYLVGLPTKRTGSLPQDSHLSSAFFVQRVAVLGTGTNSSDLPRPIWTLLACKPLYSISCLVSTLWKFRNTYSFSSSSERLPLLVSRGFSAFVGSTHATNGCAIQRSKVLGC